MIDTRNNCKDFLNWRKDLESKRVALKAELEDLNSQWPEYAEESVWKSRADKYRKALKKIRDTKYEGARLLNEPTLFQRIAKEALKEDK